MLPWLKLGSPMLSQSSFYSFMCLSAIFLRIEPSLSLRLVFCACACGQFLFVMKSRLQLGSEVYAQTSRLPTTLATCTTSGSFSSPSWEKTRSGSCASWSRSLQYERPRLLRVGRANLLDHRSLGRHGQSHSPGRVGERGGDCADAVRQHALRQPVLCGGEGQGRLRAPHASGRPDIKRFCYPQQMHNFHGWITKFCLRGRDGEEESAVR